MSKLFKSDADVRQFLPNMILSVKGEVPLLEKISTYVDNAENWVMANFTGAAIFDDIAKMPEEAKPLNCLKKLVMAKTLRSALPALDVVLSPNGFAITNTANLAPASAHRIANLDASLGRLTDELIQDMITVLPCVKGWLDTVQAQFFRSSLCYDLNSIADIVSGDESPWAVYMAKVRTIADVEESLADSYFSHKLLSALRAEMQAGTVSHLIRRQVALAISVQALKVVAGGAPNVNRLTEIVDFIRSNPDVFPEWVNSPAAKLFEPPIFTNKKNSSGYFF